MKSSQNLTRRNFVQGAARLVLSSAALSGCKSDTLSTPSKRWVVACRDNLLKLTQKPDSFSAMKELGVTGAEVEVNPELACPALYAPNKTYSLATASGI